MLGYLTHMNASIPPRADRKQCPAAPSRELAQSFVQVFFRLADIPVR